MPKESRRKRPFGLVIIILLQLVMALWLMATILVASIQLTENIRREILLIPGALVLIYQLTVITGLWLLRRWAWLLLMIQLGLGMGVQLFLYFEGKPPYIYMLISVITVLYLNQREVQRTFETQNQPRSAP